MQIHNLKSAGGKGFNLQVLLLNNFRVPEFIIFTQDDWNNFCSDLSLWPGLQHCSQWGPVAVRSSGSLEDGNAASFAGLFKTCLNIQGHQQIQAAIREVWASQDSDALKNYLKSNNLDKAEFSFSIVIQKMIQPDLAGVSFSANPVNGSRQQCFISFIDGLGEKLVSGDETGSSIVLSHNGDLISEQGDLKLSEKQRQQLLINTQQAAKVFRCPVDVEWAYEKDNLYLLQARPITSPLGQSALEPHTIFDNSNIQESYNGITTPLTYTYAVEAYHQVYNQIMKLMKMSEEDIEKAQFRHRHMLGLVEGRVYYNINSWYEGLLCLPHFGRQKEAMEKMMGLQKPVDFVQDVPLSTKEKLKRIPGLLILFIRLIYQFSKIDTHVIKFTSWFEGLENRYDPSQNQFLDNDQLIRRLYDFQKATLEKWGVPILNDFLVMMTHGSLKKTVEQLGLEAEFNLALQGSDVESVKPSRDLQEIAQIMKKVNFWSHIKDRTDTNYLELYLKKSYPHIYERIQNHICRFGDRSFAELKLETMTYRQDATPLFNLLYELTQSASQIPTKSCEDSAVADFLKKYKAKAGFLKSINIKNRLKKVKKAIAHRELMRLHRTRVFGMNREYYLEIGRRLTHLKILNNHRDIFYLTRQEIFDFFWGHSVLHDLKGLVDLRQNAWKRFQDRQLDQQVSAAIPNAYWTQKVPNKNAQYDLNVKQLQGLGCSNGIVRGIVKKVSNPYDVSGLQNKILLAERTDPGWTPLFSMITGAIIERGSALSHSAVIAREMGLPVVVGIDHITQIIFDGDEVEIDGLLGTVRILNRGNHGATTN